MQVLDWLSEKDYSEAIDRVWHVRDLISRSANIAMHHLSLQMCIYHTMTLAIVSFPICCRPCSWRATSTLEVLSWIDQVDPMDLKDVEAVEYLEV